MFAQHKFKSILKPRKWSIKQASGHELITQESKSDHDRKDGSKDEIMKGRENEKTPSAAVTSSEVSLVQYEDEGQLEAIMSLVDRDLSEPYSIFTYRYFLHNWPGLCFMVRTVFDNQGRRDVGGVCRT